MSIFIIYDILEVSNLVCTLPEHRRDVPKHVIVVEVDCIALYVIYTICLVFTDKH